MHLHDENRKTTNNKNNEITSARYAIEMPNSDRENVTKILYHCDDLYVVHTTQYTVHSTHTHIFRMKKEIQIIQTSLLVQEFLLPIITRQ